MFRLNESLEINTKKLCNLNESSDKSAKSLQASIYAEGVHQRICSGEPYVVSLFCLSNDLVCPGCIFRVNTDDEKASPPVLCTVKYSLLE